MISAPDSGYKFGTKNNWRGWVWNRIKNRLNVPAREALVLYLAGPDDLDRPHAIRRGFKANNLIAVDRDSHLISGLRKSGALAVSADLVDLLTALSLGERRIDVVLGDFCCGLEAKHLGFLAYMPSMPAFRGCVWALNFMRGRDASTNWWRKITFDTVPALWPFVDAKHRGAHFILRYAQIVVETLGQRGELRDEQEAIDYLLTLPLVLAPDFHSYKSSSRQVFDSCVFSYPSDLANTDKGWLPTDLTLMPIAKKRYLYKFPKIAAQSRRMNAVLAHRTMRGP